MSAKDNSPLASGANESIEWNFKQIGHHELDGFGGMGEGMAVQVAPDGRRIIWLAHESAPKNFTGVDVSDPRKPKVVVQTALPHNNVRSNSLELTGNILAVAYQTKQPGQTPAGFDLFDVSKPEEPKHISFFDCSGPKSRGVHQLWFADGEYVHMAAGADDFIPNNQLDDQCYRIIDVRNPSKPTEVGRWWLPGTRQGDNVPPPERHKSPLPDMGFRAHNTNVYPQRPDRAYLGYLDGGMIILDISNKAAPQVVSRWDHSPPYSGFTHTLVPFFNRNLLIMTDESIVDRAADWPKLVWILDNRDETNPIPIATCPMPPVEAWSERGGRFGAHNLHENTPSPHCWYSEDVVVGTFFNGGLRAYDLSNPYQPKEIAAFVPPAPALSKSGAIQLNDVFIDERQIVYTIDRMIGGLYILEMGF
jgi:hypothetical protein